MSTVSAAPLFFGGVEPDLNGVLQETALVLAAPLDDSLLTDLKDRAVGRRGGKIGHLFKEAGIPPNQVLVAGFDF